MVPAGRSSRPVLAHYAGVGSVPDVALWGEDFETGAQMSDSARSGRI